MFTVGTAVLSLFYAEGSDCQIFFVWGWEPFLMPSSAAVGTCSQHMRVASGQVDQRCLHLRWCHFAIRGWWQSDGSTWL